MPTQALPANVGQAAGGQYSMQSICYGDPRFLYRRCINTKLVGGRAEPHPPPPSASHPNL